MRDGDRRKGWPGAALAAAAVLALMALAGGTLAGGIAPRVLMTATDTPPGSQPGEASPAPTPAPAPDAPAAENAAALPRVVRVVCTDHLCGGCDGKCRRDSGHVAVDKKGHCSCTPTEGSDLDRATREAFARKPPQ